MAMTKQEIADRIERMCKDGTVHRGFHPPGFDPDNCEACYKGERNRLNEMKKIEQRVQEDICSKVGCDYDYTVFPAGKCKRCGRHD